MSLPTHDYEELRNIVVGLLTGTTPPTQYANLINEVAMTLYRRGQLGQQQGITTYISLPSEDAELVRDIFWDMFRQGYITLGTNDPTTMWPWFRLSRFGKEALVTQTPYRFHDVNSFLTLVKGQAPKLEAVTLDYLGEAVSAFYAGCLLACCVMLGVAAESEFLRLAEAALNNPTYGPKFQAMNKERAISRKIDKFHESIKPIQLPQAAAENLETNLSTIQAILRVARNDSGHPTGIMPQREQVYVNMQCFVPFAKQVSLLRDFFA